MSFLLDLTHTSHTQARTGIQRVTRSLWQALGTRAEPITHDPTRQCWRPLEPWELANLRADATATKRGARWPLGAQLRGHASRLLGQSAPPLPDNPGLIVPEVFSATVAGQLPALFAQTRGPRIAVFHDAIALRYPELTPPKTVARFPAYLVELLGFDGIAAVSDDSRAALKEYWEWLEVRQSPPVETITLGTDAPATRVGRDNGATSSKPVVLSVGSIEGRKNHVALLDACERLWAQGAVFELHLVGLAHAETGRAALELIQRLQAAGRPIRYAGPVNDQELEAAYARCAFTIYPSLAEGFGLPVIESLIRGKPCICSSRGALGESARGGGCRIVDAPNAENLARAMGEMLHTPGVVAQLAAEARTRRFKNWTAYADELVTWMLTLPARKQETHSRALG
jgi:glycosyltransferase involved in cell wall biosynthesis